MWIVLSLVVAVIIVLASHANLAAKLENEAVAIRNTVRSELTAAKAHVTTELTKVKSLVSGDASKVVKAFDTAAQVVKTDVAKL